MTANHAHTPTTGQIETGFALYLHDYENIVIGAGRDRFKAWLAARDARIRAAAEQRGAAKALLKAADAIRENRLPSGNEHTELCDNCSIAAADHLLDRADLLECDGD